MAKAKGRHGAARLSAVAVRNLAHAGMYPDGGCLYLRVRPSGAKSWVLRILIRGHRHDIGLGGVPLVTLAEARAEALRLRRMARTGSDPLAERRRERAIIPTFEGAAHIVYKANLPNWKPRHAMQWINTLTEYAFPVLGAMQVSDIASRDVLAVLAPIWTEKHETAKRIRQRMATVFDWAIAAGFRQNNPVHGITKGLAKVSPTVIHREALAFAEVPAFLRRLRALHTPAALALEYLILTAGRTAEVLGATWEEIDTEARVWTIPRARMKSNREHRIPLADRCLEILAEVGTHEGYLFPGRKGSLSRMTLMAMAKRMIPGNTVHGFRSSFRDWASERTRYSREVCEAALAHTVGNRTELAYRRSDLFEKRRRMIDAWATYCTRPDADVVPLRAKGA